MKADTQPTGRESVWRVTQRFMRSRHESGAHVTSDHIPLSRAQSCGHTLLQKKPGNVVWLRAPEKGETGCSEHSTVLAPDETSQELAKLKIFRYTSIMIKMFESQRMRNRIQHGGYL